ncbi:Hint domain-containing protein [Paenibacillus athensensis]|uniref:Hint domain-containing protein n=1 Tax=Paenibacillus athensensis TaxID=1967502 RepID=A0A4Y8PVZ8_9BACL|nr:polymorphic toxin-type HINT domain-containing protein [Paenibacillus athensensis]MCD1258816.1 Hint domain-containing protein [Paenibacillus athensensis]
MKSQVNYAYDSFGNAVQITIKDDNNRNTVINRSYGTVYINGFLTSQSTSVTDVNGQASTVTENMQYNLLTGAMTSYSDGKGNATSYQYDVLGRLKKATFADNSPINVTYDDVNNRVTAVDPTGLTTITQWDPLGRKTSEGISGSGTITYGYDAYVRNVWVQDALGHRTSFGYDAWGRLTQTVYPDGFVAGVAYDDVHLTVTPTDAESNQTRETYDRMKRLMKKEWLQAGGPVTLGSYTYDYASDLLTSTDGKQQTTTYTYDSLNRLTAVTDALAQTTSYTYNLASQLTHIHYADGNTLQKQYDEMGRLIRSIDPSGQAETYTYDANSNLIKQVDRNGNVQTNAYNNRNLLTSSQLGSEMITYSYDLAGRRVTMQDATGTTAYAYDPVTKRANSVTFPDGKSIAYQFDAQGNRTQMTDPFGHTTAYGYDSRNRLTGVGAAIGNWDETYTYQKDDLLAGVQQANGINWTYGYEGANLTSLIQRKGSTLVNSFGYGYDNNFNQINKTENGTTSTYTYDPLNRIATASPFQEQYSYDARGNRQTLQTGKLLDLSGANYTYDERNRLKQVTTEDGKTVSYRYNGDGMLYERTENGVTTRYYYDGTSMIAEGTVAGGTVALKARYIRGNGLAARVDALGSKQYYLTNGHGDVVGLADATGNVINQYTYDLWGGPLTTSETVGQPFRYSGEMWDSSANLQYLRARWYSPAMGRFISEDTYEGQIDNPLSLNLYTYVHNNPLTQIDPTGHMPFFPVSTYVCMVSKGDCQRQIEVEKAISEEFISDIKTLLNPDASIADKVLAGAGFIPYSKIIRGAKLFIRLTNGERYAQKAVDISGEAIEYAKNLPCNCFTAGTKVQTDKGETNVEDIKVGDRVLSKNEETGEIAYKEVTATFNHETDEIYKIYVGEQIIEATFNHPFWVQGKGWTFVKDLKVGDLLVQSDNNTLKIDIIEKEKKQVKVYNMTVDGFHTYFVSDLSIWVHNTDCGFILSKNNIEHFKKHIASEFANQVGYLSDKQLESKLAKNSFFNPNWSKDDVIIGVQNGVNEAIENGVSNGYYYYQYRGETISIFMKDGNFDTAFGLHKLTPADFGR